ncbi:MAG: CTP synthase [Armatimonadetes bacterium]|nr:CTP synthase [Armatimonadota bacterium]MDW8121542.1 CTP synthase [Armatimonadota bacterium]
MASKRKFVFVTGGVASSLGKGVTAASLGRLLKARGLKVTLQKIDPYLNVDAGTMNPYQHGEVFVTEDGAETDLDIGHYERFVDMNLTRLSNITTGQIYGEVIRKERAGAYLGQTVQVIPHLTEEIKSRIHQVADYWDADVTIVEVGGTVGDIEGLPFLEAARQFRLDLDPSDVVYLHVTLVPPVAGGELKTKPTQHSVRELRSIGIQPDVLVCRTPRPLPHDARRKIALFCNIASEAIFEAVDTPFIYEVPLILDQQGLGDLICRRLGLPASSSDLTEWENLAKKARSPVAECEIALVGKYLQLRDAYFSVVEAIYHGGLAHNARVRIRWVDSENLIDGAAEHHLSGVSGVLVPGGFGYRGVEGKIAAIEWARTRCVPFLGLCLGLQCAVIEFARNVCGFSSAHSAEFDPNALDPVIVLMDEQKRVVDAGGTMRLGAYPCHLAEGSLARRIYHEPVPYERHRHRYEVNPAYHSVLSAQGLRFSAFSPDGLLVEMIELPDHPFFIATQFHPEFKSRPNRPHPLFSAFVSACLEQQKRVSRKEEWQSTAF